jgi:two-component system sensor histidine kinase YcbA
MHLCDILKVVTGYIRETINTKHQDTIIEVHSQVNLVVPKHYYLVSVISNLIFNSVDALADKTNGIIRVTVAEQDPHIIINVSDNGTGMDEETLGLIFQPGFTTKFNETTGDVYRGIGLSHVKIIVQEQFAGTMAVQSEPGNGTNFQVTLNKQSLTQEVSS